LPEESAFAFSGAPPFVFKGGACLCSPGRSDVVCRRPWGFLCRAPEKVVIPRAAFSQSHALALKEDPRNLLLPLRVPHPSFLRVGPVAASRNSPCRRSFLRLSPGCSPGRADLWRPWGSSVARTLFLPFQVPHPSFLRVGPVAASRNSPCRRSFLRLSPGCSPGRSDVVCRRPWGFSFRSAPQGHWPLNPL
jgi:hypothetical protein